ncbi:S1C family serine protease [Cellulomonas chengniuliangii]|uniref:Serine protease n=1 Tax=Cellulomonas chengniuliangii TaxID=2968084 RepID=A0ABY5KXB6_9CELL|nr:serine protease [Cellulomonas chengniuliangii]MCC2310200.1 serine protease [Cellulomonas chengniuliangii]MCC2319125.1 serine protease [Cellulomonas chengniuliangii]UUI74096.1 serine protease [Cellulomonas chengniuliangii]
MTTRRATPLRAAGAALAVVLAAGCGVLPSPPGPMPTDIVPSHAPIAAPTQTGNLSVDGFDAAQRMAVRIRNIGCSSLSTGSGFAIDESTLITNRHVVADSDDLQVSTYDGRDIAVTAASIAGLADLAVVRTAQPLPAAPVLAESDPAPGDPVTVVGYPLGGQLTVTSGQVIGTTTDPLNENLGEVLITDAPVEPGSSGSAALDSEGRVIGVVYAKNSTGMSFVVPVSTLRAMLADDTSFVESTSCTTTS